MISLIAAHGKNRELGLEGKIPWYIKEDFKHFKKVTMGHHLIMGRKTFESIGKVLPGRTTLIISRSNGFYPTKCFSSVEAAIEFAKKENDQEIMICGGGEIYKYVLDKNLVDRLYLSIIDFEGEADTYFPEIKGSWKLETSSHFEAIDDQPSWDLKIFNKA